MVVKMYFDANLSHLFVLILTTKDDKKKISKRTNLKQLMSSSRRLWFLSWNLRAFSCILPFLSPPSLVFHIQNHQNQATKSIKLLRKKKKDKKTSATTRFPNMHTPFSFSLISESKMSYTERENKERTLVEDSDTNSSGLRPYCSSSFLLVSLTAPFPDSPTSQARRKTKV